jgi:hypothetical protein
MKKTGLIYYPIRKAIEDKVLKAQVKGLTPAEKSLIYTLVTGKEKAVKGRGRPSETVRDRNLALICMIQKLFGEEWAGIAKVAEEFAIFPTTKESNPGHHAFAKGRISWKSAAEKQLAELESKHAATTDPVLVKKKALCLEIIKLIALYDVTVGK